MDTSLNFVTLDHKIKNSQFFDYVPIERLTKGNETFAVSAEMFPVETFFPLGANNFLVDITQLFIKYVTKVGVAAEFRLDCNRLFAID